MSTQSKNLLIVQAHPDDAEAWCAGTLALLAEKGWNITIASMTAGGLGSYETDEPTTAATRKKEAAAAAAEIGASYHCFDRHDGYLFDDAEIRTEVITLIREVRTEVVITHPPFDYHHDHRATHGIVDAATMLCTLPNVPSKARPIEKTPAFYYGTVMNLTDFLGRPAPKPDFFVDITGTPIEKKTAMLSHHASQRDLMRQMMGMDDFFGEMTRLNAEIGAMVGVEYAECYWQHLGGGFPSEPLLQEELKGKIVH